jgi:hypothetical protein
MSNKVKTCAVEVKGLVGKNVLRLTEAGAVPLANGARVQLTIDTAQRLVEEYPAHLSIVGASAYGIAETSTKEEDEGFRYRVLGGKADPVATEGKDAPAAAEEGKPSNRSMAGKAQSK